MQQTGGISDESNPIGMLQEFAQGTDKYLKGKQNPCDYKGRHHTPIIISRIRCSGSTTSGSWLHLQRSHGEEHKKYVAYV